MGEKMKLEEEDKERLLELYRSAETTPVISFGVNQKSMAENAWDMVRAKFKELGEKYGFDPEDIKGIDPETGEVLLKSED